MRARAGRGADRGGQASRRTRSAPRGVAPTANASLRRSGRTVARFAAIRDMPRGAARPIGRCARRGDGSPASRPAREFGRSGKDKGRRRRGAFGHAVRDRSDPGRQAPSCRAAFQSQRQCGAGRLCRRIDRGHHRRAVAHIGHPCSTRSTMFTFKRRAIDIRTVAGELGVQYVLEGSARRSQSASAYRRS